MGQKNGHCEKRSPSIIRNQIDEVTYRYTNANSRFFFCLNLYLCLSGSNEGRRDHQCVVAPLINRCCVIVRKKTPIELELRDLQLVDTGVAKLR